MDEQRKHYRRPKRYTLGNLTPLFKAPPEGSVSTQVTPVKLDNVELRAPTPEERQRIMANIMVRSSIDARFKATWERKRSDFAKGDYSASAYDQSLANQLVAGGASEQEIVWAMYIWREMQNDRPEKVINRADYVQMTLTNAKSQNSRAVAINTISQISATVEARGKLAPEAQAQVPEQQVTQEKTTGMKAVSDLLGREVSGLEQDGTENSNYYLCFDDGTKVMIGKVADLFDQKKVKHRIAEVTRYVIPNMKGHEWEHIVKLLLNFSSEARDNPSLQPKDRIRGWLKHYVEGAVKLDDEQDEGERKKLHYAALRASNPYFENGHAAINAEAFRSWCYREYSEKPSKEEVAYVFDHLGAQKKRAKIRWGDPTGIKEGRARPQIERRVWLIDSTTLAADENTS